MSSREKVGVVVIGRNEGERLRRCLVSVVPNASMVVYVDSGSDDSSVTFARGLGCDVVELDTNLPFTAARARNTGFWRLRELALGLTYVQFVDGDCEVTRGWIDKALAFLEISPEIAVVCGRRRERYPGRSVYNLLCDIEWDTKVGEAKACGGDAMMRIDALAMVKGYRTDLIAGEEPELCIRLRASGWRIWRLAEEMTLHDAAMTRFSQWWRRALRCGHAYAEGVHLHGQPPERHWVKESRSDWVWAGGVPLVVLGFTFVSWPVGLLSLLIYPLQVVRLALKGSRSAKENWWYAFFVVIGKFPELMGQVKYLIRRYQGGQPQLIEYK